MLDLDEIRNLKRFNYKVIDIYNSHLGHGGVSAGYQQRKHFQSEVGWQTTQSALGRWGEYVRVLSVEYFICDMIWYIHMIYWVLPACKFPLTQRTLRKFSQNWLTTGSDGAMCIIKGSPAENVTYCFIFSALSDKVFFALWWWPKPWNFHLVVHETGETSRHLLQSYTSRSNENDFNFSPTNGGEEQKETNSRTSGKFIVRNGLQKLVGWVGLTHGLGYPTVGTPWLSGRN